MSENLDPKKVLAEMDQWLIDLEGSKARMFYRQDAIRWRNALAALEAKLEAMKSAILVAIVAMAGGESPDETRQMLEKVLTAQKEGK